MAVDAVIDVARMCGLVSDDYMAAIKEIERATGKEFGNPSNPLLFSVRSGREGA